MPTIKQLVKKGYTQAAFSQKRNAQTFAEEWRKKGYKVQTFRSTGPTTEHPKKITRNAYYVTAKKAKPSTRKPTRRTSRQPSFQQMFKGLF